VTQAAEKHLYATVSDIDARIAEGGFFPSDDGRYPVVVTNRAFPYTLH